MTIPPNQEDYLSVYGWIASSKTSFHFEAANILVDLFKKKHPGHPGMVTILIDLINDMKNQTT